MYTYKNTRLIACTEIGDDIIDFAYTSKLHYQEMEYLVFTKITHNTMDTV